ncbi:DUF2231 domain-containing protein [Microbacterium sp. 179-B 1A2 NHS]|uniref:DUF2231 domain-containing protein n=1 Tax=Microbacterium sp. 179-B 1A2 NHS TaxID=3142383 RepID=UPI0039A0C3E2
MTTPTPAPAPDAVRRAKHPIAPIAGPYGHPFHPIAVTIPIGAWGASLVFDIIGFIADDPEPFVVGARVLLIIGIVGAVLAAVLGILDLLTLTKGTAAKRTALMHMAFNTVALVLFVVSVVLRFGTPDDEANVPAFVISLVAYLGVGVSGWLGGKLAYTFGVRVADETKQAEGFR